jgi:hypothetical protein
LSHMAAAYRLNCLNKSGSTIRVVVKRGMVGACQHVSERRLDRYLCEFDFRQNTRERLGVNDVMRSEIALPGAVGKRLTYQTTGGSQAGSEEAPPF